MKEITLTKQPDGSLALVMPEETPAAAPIETAELHNAFSGGWVDKIPSYKFMGVPVGDAAKGMIVAGLGDGLGVAAIKFMPGVLSSNKYSYSLLKVLTIMALNWKPVKGFLGSDAVEKGSIILAYEGLTGLYDGRAKVAGIIGKATSKVGGAAIAANTANASASEVDYID